MVFDKAQFAIEIGIWCQNLKIFFRKLIIEPTYRKSGDSLGNSAW
jgi:hypothetical protein